MARKKLSKAQIYKEVRRILLKNQANLSKIYFSAGISSIYFSGQLVKNNGKEFHPNVVLVMTNEILKVGSIRCELDNWVIGKDGVYYIGEKEDRAA